MKTRFILVILSFFIVSNSWGAEIKFEYDAAGNRINRTINMLKSASVTTGKDTEEEPLPQEEIYSDHLNQVNILIYPNPTKGLLRVEINGNVENKPISLQVYDMNGKVLLQESNVVSSTTIDLSNHAPGIYILSLVSDTEKNEWKIIKE